jgi:hypothetical protein
MIIWRDLEKIWSSCSIRLAPLLRMCESFGARVAVRLSA